MKLICTLILISGFCLVLALPKMLPMSSWSQDDQSSHDFHTRYPERRTNKYQQQRRRLQRQLSQQPAGYCFHVWDDPTSPLRDKSLQNICNSENWSLFDWTKTPEKKSHSIHPLSRSNNFEPDLKLLGQLPNSRASEYLSLGSARHLTNQDLDNSRLLPNDDHPRVSLRVTRRTEKGTTCFRRWMTLLNRRLSGARLGDLVIPGTHNSASYSISSNGTLVEKLWISQLAFSFGLRDYFSSWARNHDDGLLAQLNAGYRCLDLRITVLPNGKFYWWHGVSGESIDAGLRDIAGFARENPGEIIILLISHLNAPGDGFKKKLPMPHLSKLELGRHFLSILGSTLVPTTNISLNPTLSSVLATGRNVIALIREDQDLVKAFPDYFWSDINNETAVEMFERMTNPRNMFRHRCNIMQKYKREFPDRMSITPAFVTHNVPNVLGGILRSTRVAWAFSLFLIYIFYSFEKRWRQRRQQQQQQRLQQQQQQQHHYHHQQQRTALVSIFLWLSFDFWNLVNFNRRWRFKRYPGKYICATLVYMGVISLSVSLGHLQQRTILNFFGFEGRATNLLEMARIANLCGDDPSRSAKDVMYRGINSMIRHWSDREHKYRLNIVLVDDFSSSQVVRTAIQENIRRTDKGFPHNPANEQQQQQQQYPLRNTGSEKQRVKLKMNKERAFKKNNGNKDKIS